MQQTNMSNLEYAIAVSLFAVAYAVFEVPSNWIMKRYVRPSRWLATLLFCWGILTIGFAGVKNFTQVTVLRFLIGMLCWEWRTDLICEVSELTLRSQGCSRLASFQVRVDRASC